MAREAEFKGKTSDRFMKAANLRQHRCALNLVLA